MRRLYSALLALALLVVSAITSTSQLAGRTGQSG